MLGLFLLFVGGVRRSCRFLGEVVIGFGLDDGCFGIVFRWVLLLRCFCESRIVGIVVFYYGYCCYVISVSGKGRFFYFIMGISLIFNFF